MDTAKDANGVEIKVGDTVRHRLVPCEAHDGGDAVHDFGGSSEIVEIISGAFVCVRANARIGIPVYCSANVVKV